MPAHQTSFFTVPSTDVTDRSYLTWSSHLCHSWMVESVGFGTLNTAQFEWVVCRREPAIGTPLPGLPRVSMTAPGLLMGSHCGQQPLDLLVTTPADSLLLSNPILSHHCCSYSIPTHPFLLTSAFFLPKSDLMEVNRNSQTDLCTTPKQFSCEPLMKP